MKNLLFTAACLCPFTHAHASSVYGEHAVGPTIYSCRAHSFRDYERPEDPGADIQLAGHEAHFEILRLKLKSQLLLRASYTFQDASGRHHASRTLVLSNARSLHDEAPQRFAQAGLSHRAVQSLLREASVTYVGFPRTAGVPEHKFYEYVNFPYTGLAGTTPAHFPVEVKIAQESVAEGMIAQSRPVWSKLYHAECYPRSVTEEEFHQRQDPSLEAAVIDGTRRIPPRQLSLPYLREALATLPVYSEKGEALGGRAAELGPRALLAVLGVQFARYVIAAFTRNPTVAAVYLPEGNADGLIINLARARVSAEQARAYFSVGPGAQEGLCAEDSGYASFCRGLAELEAQLAAGGEAF